LVAFLPVLGHGFLLWDDEENFLANPHFQGVGWPQLRWAWTTFRLGVYQPLAWMLFSAQSACWGLDPRGYHAVSLVLHALNAMVLYALTLALLERSLPDRSPEARAAVEWAAALAATLFAVHPLRTEVVAWTSSQAYLPCALFVMLSLLAYLGAHAAHQPVRLGWLAASFGLCAVALLFKASAVSLPVLLAILDVYPLRRFGPGRWHGPEALRAVLEKLPFAALSLVFLVLAVQARATVRTPVSLNDFGLIPRIAAACYAVAFYPAKTLLPVGITAFYPLPNRLDWTEPRFVLSIVLVVGLSALAFGLRRRWPGFLAVWLSYLAILAPTLGLTHAGTQIAADRYSYLASLGWLVLAAFGLVAVIEWSRQGRVAALSTAAGAASVVVVLTTLSWQQCRIWSSSEALWAHALAHGASRSAEAHNYYGISLVRAERSEEGVKHLIEAARLLPNYLDAYLNLGFALAKQERFDAAQATFAQALRLQPQSGYAHLNLGVVLAAQQKRDEAIAEFRTAARLQPDLAEKARQGIETVLRETSPRTER
jgi:hypothetical protein